jgi:Domain of unknown function (DUF4350)
MPHALDSGDRKLLIGAGVLLVVLLVATTIVSPRRASGGPSQYPSSYSADWDGAKGAYLLLQDLGYHISRSEEAPTEIDEGDEDAKSEVWIFAEPLQLPTAEEKSAILHFLLNGGRVVATGWAASRLLPQASQLRDGYAADENAKFPALLPSPLVRSAPEISMTPPDHWHPKSASQLVVYGDDNTAAVITYRVGKGQVIWWGASTPLTNAGLRESGNLAFLLNSVGPAEGIEVYWDEYFHGVHGSLWDYLGRTPVGWGALQFGIAFLAILATYSRRQGPICVPPKISRLSPLEFVETLGDLYSSAHAGSAAVRIAAQRLRFQLIRQFGLPANATNADLAHSAGKALRWDEADFSTTLARADRAAAAAKLPDAETLQIVQKIFDYTSRLGLRRVQTSERHPA